MRRGGANRAAAVDESVDDVDRLHQAVDDLQPGFGIGEVMGRPAPDDVPIVVNHDAQVRHALMAYDPALFRLAGTAGRRSPMRTGIRSISSAPSARGGGFTFGSLPTGNGRLKK
ncbi:hypothetical protein AB1399_11325, partial [Hydrogenibacillus schlegelii]|uniref:hypothetical protein n=1 Tax=Hydrogenibacillus schlegelii TaxID=1484 RepID=UPI0034A04567